MATLPGITQEDIIYFVLIDRFARGGAPPGQPWSGKLDLRCYCGGNLAGIIEKIPYLKHLGVTALWITPVYLGIGSLYTAGGEIIDNYHGYWPLDFTRIEPRLLEGWRCYDEYASDPEGISSLRVLTEALHAHGIKLVLDIIVSHTGYHNQFYRRYRGSKIPEQWFKPPGEEGMPFGLPALDHRRADVCDYFVNNIIDWIEIAGIDAIRLDAARHIDRQFWSYFKSYVRGKYRHIFFLGEVLDFDENSVAAYQREFDFDSLFDFPLCGNIIDVLIRNEDYKPQTERRGMMAIAGPPLPDGRPAVVGVLDTDWKYNNANRLVILVDNHDLEKRIMSWALAYSNNDRLRAVQLVKYALTFLFTTRGIPQIYYGTEIGLEGDRSEGGDHYLRRPMPWQKIDPATLEPYPHLTVEAAIYHYLRRLIALRRSHPALPFGYLFTLHSSFDYYVFLREFRGDLVLVALNNQPVKVGEEKPQEIVVDLMANPLIPSRVRERVMAAGRLVCVLKNSWQGAIMSDTVKEDEAAEICCRSGQLIFRLRGKEAGVYVPV